MGNEGKGKGKRQIYGPEDRKVIPISIASLKKGY